MKSLAFLFLETVKEEKCAEEKKRPVICSAVEKV